MDITVRNRLIKMGIRPNILGFHYLDEAITRVSKEYLSGNWSIKFTDLYAEIARKFHTTAYAVERAMRNAITTREKPAEHIRLSEFISENADRLCYS